MSRNCNWKSIPLGLLWLRKQIFPRMLLTTSALVTHCERNESDFIPLASLLRRSLWKLPLQVWACQWGESRFDRITKVSRRVNKVFPDPIFPVKVRRMANRKLIRQKNWKSFRERIRAFDENPSTARISIPRNKSYYKLRSKAPTTF